MLVTAITISIILLLIMIIIPFLANISTPNNLTNWYTSKFYKFLIPSILIVIIILWILYFIFK